MIELTLPYNLESHVLDLPPQLESDLEVSLMGKRIRGQEAFDAINPEHQKFLLDNFTKLFAETYRRLQDPLTERGALISAINGEFNRLITLIRLIAITSVQTESRWAYPLTLARGWAALDLVFMAHQGLDYSRKRIVYITQANHYPALLEMFEQPEIKLARIESEVLADICEGAGGNKYSEVFKIARGLVAAIPNTRLGTRTSQPNRLGIDFIETILSMNYTKPA